MIGILLFVISTLKINHFELNQNPTFSYLIINLNSSKFDFVQKIVDETIVIIIHSAQIPERKGARWEKDKYFDKVHFSEIVEDERKSALISIHLKRSKEIKWHIARSGSAIIIFAGKDIPFTDKIDIEEYMRSSVETRNYGAIDILFDFSKSDDNEISAKALFYIGEMLFRMGIEAKEITTLLKSANFYSNAAKKFSEIGKIVEAVESKYKSSKAFRISGFYPEAKFQSESGLNYLIKGEGILSSQEKNELETKLICSQSIALVGMNKAGEAVKVIEGIKDGKISEEAYDCYWSAIGVIEFEKGNFEKSAEFISYVSDNFIKYDPVILPRYVKSLIRTKRGYLARKYIGFMINSQLQELKPEALILLSESLLHDGDEMNSLKFLYRVMREYPGTKWEIKARLFAVLNREKYLKISNKVPKNEIPQDDPISKTIPNIKFIITKFLAPESQLALKEYLKIISDKIEKDQDIENDLKFLKEVLPTIKALKIAPDLYTEISESMYGILKSLYDKDEKIKAFVFYSENKDILPPLKDYSFIESIQREIGGEKDINLELAQIEILSEEQKCDEAYERIKKLKDEMDPREYSIGILKVALCFFRMKDPKFRQICKEEVSELETICYPQESTDFERIKSLIEEITREYQETTKEIKEKLK